MLRGDQGLRARPGVAPPPGGTDCAAPPSAAPAPFRHPLHPKKKKKKHNPNEILVCVYLVLMLRGAPGGTHPGGAAQST